MKSFVGPVTRESMPLDPVLQRREYTPEGSDYVDAVVLVSNTSKAHAIPTTSPKPEVVNFSGNGDFYVKFGSDSGVGTIAIPSADLTDGSSPMLNPGSRIIPEGSTTIYLIAPTATIVTMEFWSD